MVLVVGARRPAERMRRTAVEDMSHVAVGRAGKPSEEAGAGGVRCGGGKVLAQVLFRNSCTGKLLFDFAQDSAVRPLILTFYFVHFFNACIFLFF